MLKLENVSFSYGAIMTLRQVNMIMERNQITCVIGRNGVGKTTLMKNIMGSLRTNSGRIWLEGQDICRLPANKRAKAGVALVPQGRHIFPNLTVEENLRVGLEARTDGKRTIPDEVFDLFPVLKSMSERKGGDLSGGQQQQLAIGRALVGDPKVILLDEPTEGIQPNIIERIGIVLRDLVIKKDVAVVIVEQFLDFVKEFGHRFYIMNRGTVVAQGATPELTEKLITAHLHV
ncbi:MAG: urea ABC transporter ATP-binding subunit UrtE [Deltaproteobacteria bacterium]|nr:urea ABC transporter ATP-binding subunit UrtE [Deltaproteobacteria bacterium]